MIIDRFVYLRIPLISVPSYSCSVLQVEVVDDSLWVSSVFLKCYLADSQMNIKSILNLLKNNTYDNSKMRDFHQPITGFRTCEKCYIFSEK